MWGISVAVLFWGVHLIQCLSNTKLFNCHDDPATAPEVGVLDEVIFNWLGILQYIHIKSGKPHFFRVPRVALISQQYVLCTAHDASHVPEGYALGNVAFGEYERDDEECVREQCPVTGLMVPLSDVIVHPEYEGSRSPYSIALLKLLIPIKSKYMVPVCLPYKNYVSTRKYSSQIRYKLIHVDYVTPVPRHFIEEEKEVSKISPLVKEVCYLYDKSNKLTLNKRKTMCTSGCDFHSGAPSLVHEHTGHWTLVSISQGGTACPDPLRETSQQPPLSRHTLIYPYVSWMMAEILGEGAASFSDDEDNPFGYIMPPTRKSSTKLGRWFMGGYRCFDRGPSADNMFRFYYEEFETSAAAEGSITYLLEINAKPSLLIDCVKIGPITKFLAPVIWGIDTNQVKVHIQTPANQSLRFQVHAWAHKRPIDVSYEDKPSGSGYTDSEEYSDEEYSDTTENPLNQSETTTASNRMR